MERLKRLARYQLGLMGRAAEISSNPASYATGNLGLLLALIGLAGVVMSMTSVVGSWPMLVLLLAVLQYRAVRRGGVRDHMLPLTPRFVVGNLCLLPCVLLVVIWVGVMLFTGVTALTIAVLSSEDGQWTVYTSVVGDVAKIVVCLLATALLSAVFTALALIRQAKARWLALGGLVLAMVLLIQPVGTASESVEPTERVLFSAGHWQVVDILDTLTLPLAPWLLAGILAAVACVVLPCVWWLAMRYYGGVKEVDVCSG